MGPAKIEEHQHLLQICCTVCFHHELAELLSNGLKLLFGLLFSVALERTTTDALALTILKTLEG